MEKKNTRRGFTLVELLVVVLIIAILAAVAVPQYQKVVEKARMAEAVVVVRAIANAQQLFYLQNGRYASDTEMDLLDVQIPGRKLSDTLRISSNYFQYSPNNAYGDFIALAKRFPLDHAYHIHIRPSAPSKIRCSYYEDTTPIQKKLCQELATKGTL